MSENFIDNYVRQQKVIRGSRAGSHRKTNSIAPAVRQPPFRYTGLLLAKRNAVDQRAAGAGDADGFARSFEAECHVVGARACVAVSRKFLVGICERADERETRNARFLASQRG